MRIALFGGRFDPVHNGHISIAKEVIKHAFGSGAQVIDSGVAQTRGARREDIDELWFIPDNIHQWNPIIASASDRLRMLKLALLFFSQKIKVKDIAVRTGGQTNTIDIITILRKENPHDSFIFICGSDQIKNFHKWTKWDELEKSLEFLIIPRKGFPIDVLPSNCKVLSDKTYKPLDDASTAIRERIKNGQSITGLVPKAVEEYIIEHKLYK